MTVVRRSLVLAVVAAVFVAATSVSASAATIQVSHGDSIQDAVDAAHRGDTIVVHKGTFRGGVKIKKNQLTLLGAGDGKNGTVIKPGRHNSCGGGAAGICVGSRAPHGHPIPARDLTLAEQHLHQLAVVDAGTKVRVERVSDRDGDRLRYLAELGVTPGTVVEVVRREPFEGPITLQIGRTERVIGPALAAHVLVSEVKKRAKGR